MDLSTSKESKRKAALRSQVAALHAELEIISSSSSGRRKDTRKIQKEKTIKRKILEREDRKELAIHGDDNTSKRLRGSKAALEDEVVNSSLIFGSNEPNEEKQNDEVMIGEEGSEYDDDDEFLDENDNYLDEDENSDLQVDGDDDDDNEDDDDDNSANEEYEKETKKRKGPSRTNNSLINDPDHHEKVEAAKKHFPHKKIARTMYRLNNFKSHRMAEKHGDALGKHALGLNRSAVSKLKEVANAAPIAPQVYSSLGLVYESMLNDEIGKANFMKEKDDQEQQERQDIGKSNAEEKDLDACIELAKKTFGSYHVAALLCKMDYTLWLRAGDAAMKVANLHDQCLSVNPNLYPYNNNDNDRILNKKSFTSIQEYIRYHRQEKNRWLEEAKDDYSAADNINPPGVAIPAKLAHVHIQLGNLSEALTILTDLKNKSIKRNIDKTDTSIVKRSELEKSYYVWMLYADLMLTIGFECNKWNRGDQTNDNYMFRRWLRKYADTFDWRERRLQSLCLALEAAAGTTSCKKIIAWMQDRAATGKHSYDTYDFDRQATKTDTDVEAESLAQGENKDTRGDENDNRFEILCNSQNLTVEDLTDTFNRDRDNLLSKNRRELEQFDCLTSEMNLVTGSDEEKIRVNERENLLKHQKSELIELAGQYRLKKIELERSQVNLQEINPQLEVLPPSASCATTCDIASQLMKLCLGMNLFRVGRLTASVVSQYLKERAEGIKQKRLELKAYENKQIETSSKIFQISNEIHDDLQNEIDQESDDNHSMMYFSDEEEFDMERNKDIIEMMEHGVLPPEIQFLRALCLIGEGGSDFLAGKSIEVIMSFNNEYLESYRRLIEHGSTKDASFEIFRGTMMDTINSKTAAFSLLTDILLKTKKEEEWSVRLLPLYQSYINEIEQSDEVGILRVDPSSLSPFMSITRNCYIKALLALQRMRLVKANRSNHPQELNKQSMLQEGYEDAIAVIDTIYRYRTALLLEINRDIHNDAKETIRILSGCFRIISAYIDMYHSNDEFVVLDILSRLRTAVCWFCQTTIPNHEDVFSSKSLGSVKSWGYFPIASDWQTEELKSLSRRAFNLCVACNVSAFSGWEKDEFDLKLMRKKKETSFFGCNIKGSVVAGSLDFDKERELSHQWEQVERLLPSLSYFDFDSGINTVKKSDWFIDTKSKLQEISKVVSIPSCAESEALNIMLMFSKISLLFANKEKDQQKQECLIKNAMSIILPISQFCLDEILWDSEIGTNAGTSNENISEWELFAQNAEATPAPKPQRKPSSSKKSSQRQGKSSSDALQYRYKTVLTKLVKVPVDLLLNEWIAKEGVHDTDNEEKVDRRLNIWSQTVSGAAKLAMKRVDYTMNKLRECMTIHTLQKASLQVALALLELMATKECQNPILCLYQASIFASQGPKGGNNDEEFKHPLPEVTVCTPTESLVILGRADCLRAINFIDEAMFLCTFVAKVCTLHRDKTNNEYLWTPQWRVISILVYTISIAIDATMNSSMGEDDRISWEKEVKAEISRGRSDAISLRTLLSKKEFKQQKSMTSNTPFDTIHHKEDKQNLDDDDYGDYEEEEEYDEDDDAMDVDDDFDDDDSIDKDQNIEHHSGRNEEYQIPIPNSTLNLTELLPDTSTGTDDVDFDEIPVVPV